MALDSVFGRVARWFVCKAKIQIWVNFGGPWNGKCWHNLWPFGIPWFTLRPFGIFSVPFAYFPPELVFCTKKNLATLVFSQSLSQIFCQRQKCCSKIDLNDASDTSINLQ
jgi:hypothetical protein